MQYIHAVERSMLTLIGLVMLFSLWTASNVQAAATCETLPLASHQLAANHVVVGTITQLRGLPVLNQGVESGDYVLGAHVQIAEVFKGDLSASAAGETPIEILVATPEPTPYSKASPAGEVVYEEGQRYLFFLHDGVDSRDYNYHIRPCNGTRLLESDLSEAGRAQLSGVLSSTDSLAASDALSVSSAAPEQVTSTSAPDGKGGPPTTLAQSGIGTVPMLISFLGLGVIVGLAYRLHRRFDR